MIYGGPAIIYLAKEASIEHVPKSQKLGVYVEQTKDRISVVITECRVYCRKTGMQFSPSDLVTFGWKYADIESVWQPKGEAVWINEDFPRKEKG